MRELNAKQLSVFNPNTGAYELVDILQGAPGPKGDKGDPDDSGVDRATVQAMIDAAIAAIPVYNGEVV